MFLLLPIYDYNKYNQSKSTKNTENRKNKKIPEKSRFYLLNNIKYIIERNLEINKKSL